MRILMLAQFYPPSIGGTERHVHDLSVELAARGHDVTVVTLWKEGTPAFECDQGVHIYRIHGSLQRVPAVFIDKRQQHSPPFPDPEALWALHRIIIHERPDIIHAHDWLVHSFTLLKAWSKAKLVVTLHDCSLICAKKGFVCHGALCSGPALTKCLGCAAEHYGLTKGIPITLGNWTGGKVVRRVVDMFLPVSKAIAEVTQLARNRVPYHIIPNFTSENVDPPCSHADPLLAQLPQDNYLLFVGNIGREKGVEVLLRAYNEMRTNIPLILIGQPAVGFPAHFPPNVQILQSWPHTAVMSAWKRCSIGLVPSICFEAFGIVALEAMTMGRPVIASRIGGLPEVVADGESGLLVTPGDWRELKQAIQCLLDDPLLRERMGALAKQRVVEFQARTVITRIEQVYQEVSQS